MTLTTIATCWLCFTGTLSGYHFRPTYGTIAWRQDTTLPLDRQIPQDLTPYDVFLAVPNCGAIGWTGTLTVNGQVYSALIFDCAGKDSHKKMIEQGIAAEVDYRFWMAHPEYVGTGVRAVIEVKPPKWRAYHE